MNRERAGLVYAGFCVLNGALVPALAKLTTTRAAALFVGAMTALFAGIFAAAILAARGELAVLWRRGIRLRLLCLGALGTSVSFVLFYTGAQRSTAVETVLCLQIEPLYALFAAWVLLGHRPTRRRLLALVVLVSGIVLAIGPYDLSASSGIWLLLATPACWQASHLVVLRGLVGVPASVLTAARYVYGGLLLAICWLVMGAPTGTASVPQLMQVIPLLALQGVVFSYMGTWFWYQAIARLDLARATAVVVPSIPVLSVGASFVILGEVPTVAQWLGLLLTASGVLAFATAPAVRAHTEASAIVATRVAPAS